VELLRLEEVSKCFGTREVLSSVSLSLEEGELLTLLGPSGAGKTTLMRIINLLERPTSGRVLFRGRNLLELHGEELLELRRRMVMVFQKPVMFSGDVYHNLAFGLRVRRVPEREIRRRVREALELVGMRGYERRDARTLSGGEAQRIAFARAMVLEPELVLLDEPTTSLDPVMEARVHGIIAKMRERGMSIILTTHKQEEALTLGDRIAVLRGGRLEQVGTPAEVVYHPRSRFVAEFTGMCNIYEGRVVESVDGECVVRVGEALVRLAGGAEAGERVCLGIRPEDVMLIRTDVPPSRRHTNLFSGVVRQITPRGGAMLRLRISGPLEVLADVPRHVVEKMHLHPGGEVVFSLKRSCIRLLED